MAKAVAVAPAKINLAPEVYQTAQANRRRRHMATGVAVGVAVLCGGAVAMMLLVIGGQKFYLSSLKANIQSNEQKVQAIPNLQQAATAEQHLVSLGSLQGQRLYMTQLFNVLQQVEPQGLALTQLGVTGNQVQLNGTAKSYSLITKFAKALEADNLTIGSNASPTNQPNFTSVNLQQASSNGDGTFDFQMTASVDSGVTSGH